MKDVSQECGLPEKSGYAVQAFCRMLFVPPFTGVLGVFLMLLIRNIFGYGVPEDAIINVSLSVISFFWGWFWSGKTSLPDTLFARLMPLFLPAFCFTLLYLVIFPDPRVGLEVIIHYAEGYVPTSRYILFALLLSWFWFSLAALLRYERRRIRRA